MLYESSSYALRVKFLYFMKSSKTAMGFYYEQIQNRLHTSHTTVYY